MHDVVGVHPREESRTAGAKPGVQRLDERAATVHAQKLDAVACRRRPLEPPANVDGRLGTMVNDDDVSADVPRPQRAAEGAREPPRRDIAHRQQHIDVDSFVHPRHASVVPVPRCRVQPAAAIRRRPLEDCRGVGHDSPMATHHGPPTDVDTVLRQIPRPPRVVVTAGMPYANGPLHLGHLAGAHLPADIYARFMTLLVGRQNVLFVCGTDEHGSTTELAALKAGRSARELLDEVHDRQALTLARYDIGLDVYSGTSRPDCFPIHAQLAQSMLTRLHENGMLEKRSSMQWFDPKVQKFLSDRLVRGTCPKCGTDGAYSDECDACGSQYEPTSLLHPKSAISDATPEMRETKHWFLDMSRVQDQLYSWILDKEKKKSWRQATTKAVIELVRPCLRFDNVHEPAYKEAKAALPKHKSRYAPGKKVELVFDSRADLAAAAQALAFPTTIPDEWAKRSITRDIAWGLPLPDLDPDLQGKTLYVWPDSLIAPIAFSKVARADGEDFWRDPSTKIMQFLGQDNVFFYVLMQGAMWLGSQADIHRLPVAGELQLTDVTSCSHLLVNGEKMSKSKGNFFTGDQLLNDMGYSADQIRYFLATLNLADDASDFAVEQLNERNKFLGGILNAALERPISAAHSKFEGRVPDGKLLDAVVTDTIRMVQRYAKAMEKSSHPGLLTDLENYARHITSLFAQAKPHDDRYPLEARKDALFTGLYVLKNLMIMLWPFVPSTMDRVRQALNLPPSVFTIDELGKPLPAGHVLGAQQQYFPAVG
jgi:methionyl-tRNA synthetase